MVWNSEKLEAHYKQQTDQWSKAPLCQGKNELLSHFAGERLTKQQSITAFCYQCMGGYGDGEARDCNNPPCPLYPYHPYNPVRVKTRPGGTFKKP